MLNDLQQSIRRGAADVARDLLGVNPPDEGADSPESSEQLQQLLHAAIVSTANPVVITDASGTILWTNPAFTVLTGYTAAEAVGQSPRILKSGRHGPAFYQDIWRTVKSGQTWRGELTNRRKDGQLYHGEQTITPVVSATGTITHFVAMMNDITARRESENRLRIAHLQMQHLLDHSPVALYGAKWNNGIVPTFVSDNVARLLGFPLTERVTFDWWLERLHPEDRDRAMASINETLTHQESVVEYRLQHRDGGYRWMEDRCQLIRDAGARPDEFVGVLADITGRKRAEDVLRRQAAKQSDRLRRRVIADTFVVVGGALLVFSGGWFFGWFERMFAALADEQNFPLFDEVAGTGCFVLLAMLLFSIRRYREGRDETISQQNVAAALQTLNAELEARVQQRTSELERANERLQAEVMERRRVEAEQSRLRDELARREAAFRSFFCGATAGLAHLDRDLRYVHINPTLADMNGSPVATHLGRTVAEMVPALAPAVEPMLRQVLATNQPILNLEINGDTHHEPDAHRSWIASYFPVRGSNGQAEGVGAVVIEITQRKQVEAALRESEARFRQLAETVEEMFWLLDPARNELLYVSPGYARIWGRSCAELMENPVAWQNAIHPEDRARVALAARHEAIALYNEEYRIVRPDGEVRWIHDRAYPVRGENGEILRLAGVAADITDRKRTAAALQEAKEQYQLIFQNAVAGIYQTSPDGRFLAANPAMARILGFSSAEELVAQRPDIGRQGYVNPARREEFKVAIERRGFVTDFEYEVHRKDGGRVWVSENARVVRDAAGGISHYEGSMTDVTERRRATIRLKLQHAVTQALAECGSLETACGRILEIIGRSLEWPAGEWWMIDRNASHLALLAAWHPPSSDFAHVFAASRALTFARGVGLPGRVWELGRAEWFPDITQTASCPRREIFRPLGLPSWIGFPIKVRDEVVGVVGFFSGHAHEPDAEMVSTLAALGTQIGQFIERLHLAEQFRHAQKMEAVGTLAGGIAHDFNNIIAAISGYSELAKMELGEKHPVARHLDAVMTGSRRAATLVRQILTFSRQHEQERKPIQLRHIVAEAMNLLRATVPAMIEFDFTFSRELPAVLADATQVHQVVMNLGTNAWHAMRDKPGRLTVDLDRGQVDAPLAELHPGLRVGDYVLLSVTDTGEGMDRATMGRIFEPFFTTKAPGVGTGLGLAVVHGIMRAHEGAVLVDSRPGEGTTFRLYFPAVPDEAAESVADASNIPRGRGECVLWVDDEQPLAAMGKKVLERLGYCVEPQTSPVEALAQLRAQPARYALLITDLAMPVMSGIELAREALAIRTELPIILITGYAPTHTLAGVRAAGIREMLTKPISLHALGTTVASVLTETEPPSHAPNSHSG